MKIRVENLCKRIKKNTILNNINLDLEGGKIYGLQGKNGCGKTMLMRCLSGLVIPTSGKIIIDDRILYEDISLPESIGVLLENPSFLEGFSGYENLKMLADLRGGENLTSSDINLLLERVGLPQNSKKYKEYSLGMKQRLGVAAAIMGKPKIIILDEPINAIDEEGVSGIRDEILALKSEERIIIIACHDKEEMNLFADEIFCMREGGIYAVIKNDKT